MPFTAAHPLAVWPLVRWHHRLGLDPTCLVIGSMAPDFEYFARGEQVSTISHTLHGLWMWNLPATLVLAGLVHAIVKWPVVLVAPRAAARRLIAVARRRWPARWSAGPLVGCAVSAVLGSATHLAWDGLTHADGWGPRVLPGLTAPLAVPGLGTLVVHRALQHASTLVGLVALAAVIARGLGRHAPIEPPVLPRGAARLLVAGCVVTATLLATWRVVARHRTDPGNLVVAAIAGALAGGLVGCAMLATRGRQLARACAACTQPDHASSLR